MLHLPQNVKHPLHCQSNHMVILNKLKSLALCSSTQGAYHNPNVPAQNTDTDFDCKVIGYKNLHDYLSSIWQIIRLHVNVTNWDRVNPVGPIWRKFESVWKTGLIFTKKNKQRYIYYVNICMKLFLQSQSASMFCTYVELWCTPTIQWLCKKTVLKDFNWCRVRFK